MNRRERSDRRRAAIAERKAATRARLSAPARPPTEPVALPWKRRRPRVREPELGVPLGGPRAVITPIVSHDARDLAGSIATVAIFSRMLGQMLRPRT